MIDAPEFGVRLRIELIQIEPNQNEPIHIEPIQPEATENGSVGGRSLPQTATLRNWRPGDRVRLRHSSAPRKVKEVLERLHVTGTERAVWPVLEAGGRILWMKGVELEREPGLAITSLDAAPDGSLAAPRSQPK